MHHSATFVSELAYLCPAVSVSSRAHHLAAWPPRCAGRSRVVAIPICSPSVSLFHRSMLAKMSGQTGAEAPLKAEPSRDVVTCTVTCRAIHILDICIYIIAEAQIDSNQWPHFAHLRSLLSNKAMVTKCKRRTIIKETLCRTSFHFPSHTYVSDSLMLALLSSLSLQAASQKLPPTLRPFVSTLKSKIRIAMYQVTERA